MLCIIRHLKTDSRACQTEGAILSGRREFTQPLRARAGFTLIEIMTASLVALYVFLSAWSIYVMTWKWWHEISPVIEAQRIARTALSSIIYGYTDASVGTDDIGLSTHSRRNGIAGAMFDDSAAPPATPVISVDHKRVDFRTEIDGSNVRAFYLGTDDVTGTKAVYYLDNSGAADPLNATKGITDLQFDYFVDGTGVTHYNIIKITARVERDVATGQAPYPVRVVYTDYIYLRNTL